ncbi:MAG TPA: NAD(P)/FAD-dependent oxidoreductase [Solirubrobacteraceae bacterium]|jgi:putative flavoprotein involved in K+ transport
MAATNTAEATREAEQWLQGFNAGLRARDAATVVALFDPTCFWRDLVALTWNIVTVEGRDAVAAMLEATLKPAQLRDVVLAEPAACGADGTVEAWLEFRTRAGRGRGHLRLRDGAAVTLLTALRALDGHEEQRGPRRPLGVEHGAIRARRSWLERRREESAALGRDVQPEVLVVGGGQAGIVLGARLRQLDVATVVVDRHPRPGDQWRGRYKSLCLHDPVWMDHLPYLPFPDTWPVFAPKDRIADWLELYVQVMDIDYWGSTIARAARFDEAAGRWEVTLERDGEEVRLAPRQLVIATGLSGRPNVPDLPGQERFAGEQHHSSVHPGADGYAGRRAVVIGSNNSAFDICAALWEAGAEVTMVQRSSTHVVRSETARDIIFKRLYSEEAVADGIDAERADLISASLPYRLAPAVHRALYDQVRERDREFYARLKGAGFLHDFGPDGTGMSMKFLRRASGYYIDVGAAELVIDGRVRLVQGQVERLDEDAVVMQDRTALPADLVVYATGYGPMSEWIADLISPEVASRVGPIWGLGSGTERDPGPWEGELRNVWSPTAQSGLWIHAGNLALVRHYSLYLALQLKARAAGLSTPVYAPGVESRA